MAHELVEDPPDFYPGGFQSQAYPAETKDRSCSMLLHRTFTDMDYPRERLRKNLVVLFRTLNYFRALEHQSGFWECIASHGLALGSEQWTEHIVRHYVAARCAYLGSPDAATRNRDSLLARLVDRWESRPGGYGFPRGVDMYREAAYRGWPRLLDEGELCTHGDENWPKPVFAPTIKLAPASPTADPTASPTSNPTAAPLPKTPFSTTSPVIPFPTPPEPPRADPSAIPCQNIMEVLAEIPGTATISYEVFHTERDNISSTLNAYKNIGFREQYQKWSTEEVRLADYFNTPPLRDHLAAGALGSKFEFYLHDARTGTGMQTYVVIFDGEIMAFQNILFQQRCRKWSIDELRLAHTIDDRQMLSRGGRPSHQQGELGEHSNGLSISRSLQSYFAKTRRLNSAFCPKFNSWTSTSLGIQWASDMGHVPSKTPTEGTSDVHSKAPRNKDPLRNQNINPSLRFPAPACQGASSNPSLDEPEAKDVSQLVGDLNGSTNYLDPLPTRQDPPKTALKLGEPVDTPAKVSSENDTGIYKIPQQRNREQQPDDALNDAPENKVARDLQDRDRIDILERAVEDLRAATEKMKVAVQENGDATEKLNATVEDQGNAIDAHSWMLWKQSLKIAELKAAERRGQWASHEN